MAFHTREMMEAIQTIQIGKIDGLKNTEWITSGNGQRRECHEMGMKNDS